MARFPPAGGTPNPYTDLLYGALRGHSLEEVRHPELTLRWLWRHRRTVGFLHFHWRPDRYYARRPSRLDAPRPRLARTLLTLGAFATRLAAARALGYRVVWTIHEVYPPLASPRRGDRWIDRVGERVLGRLSHVVLAHDHATAERARAELGGAVAAAHVVPHGPFIGVYPAGRSRAEVREELGIPPDAFAFLCFGQLRPDKAMDLVLEAFAGIERADVALVVAGHLADSRARTAIVRASREDPRIGPLVEPVPHERVAELFGAVDAAVLGRGEVWTSGSLILALSLGVPVVAARVAPHEDLLGDGEAGWLFSPGNAGSLRDALAAAASDRETARAKGRAARECAEGMPTWPEIAARTAALLLDGAAGPFAPPTPTSAPARERLEIADDSA